MKTFLTMILDQSGSMSAGQDKTIRGFNEYVDTLRTTKDLEFSLIKFNSQNTDNIKFTSVSDVFLNDENFVPFGTTPLFDAIGKTITEIDKQLPSCTCKECGCTSKPKVIVTIITDGEENSSVEFKKETIAKLIEQKEKEGWLFVYLGANQDSWANSGVINIRHANTMNYDINNIDATFNFVGNNTARYIASNYTGNILEKDK